MSDKFPILSDRLPNKSDILTYLSDGFRKLGGLLLQASLLLALEVKEEVPSLLLVNESSRATTMSADGLLTADRIAASCPGAICGLFFVPCGAQMKAVS